jgi:hypothetical protein
VKPFCIAAALALTLLVAPAHAAHWDGTQKVASGDRPIALAGTEHGRRVVGWAGAHGVFVRIAPRGGRFGPPRRIAGPPHKSDVRLAIDDRGDIAIAWNYYVDATPDSPPNSEFEAPNCCSRLMAAVLRQGGRLSRRVEVGVPNAANGADRLFSDGRGHLALAFQTFDGNANGGPLYARFGTMQRGFGPLLRMSPPGDSGLAVSAGRGRVIYGTVGAVASQTVETSRSASGELKRRVLLDFPITAEQLGTDDSGRQTAEFENGNIATRTPPSSFETVAQHYPGGPSRVSVARNGAASVAWTTGTQLMAQLRQAGAGFGAALEVDRVEADELTLDSVDAGPDGSAAVGVAVWHRQEPDPNVQTRVYLVPAGGGTADRLVWGYGADIDVLHDARGTLAVASTGEGVLARWVR